MSEVKRLIENIKTLTDVMAWVSSYTDGELLFIRHLNTELEKFISILKMKGNNYDKND